MIIEKSLITQVELQAVFQRSVSASSASRPLVGKRVDFKSKSDCSSSLTSPANCMKPNFDRKSRVAYCEQYLWWSDCPVSYPVLTDVPTSDDTCTFAVTESLTGTNSHTFEGGVTGTPGKIMESVLEPRIPFLQQ